MKIEQQNKDSDTDTATEKESENDNDDDGDDDGDDDDDDDDDWAHFSSKAPIQISQTQNQKKELIQTDRHITVSCLACNVLQIEEKTGAQIKEKSLISQASMCYFVLLHKRL